MTPLNPTRLSTSTRRLAAPSRTCHSTRASDVAAPAVARQREDTRQPSLLQLFSKGLAAAAAAALVLQPVQAVHAKALLTPDERVTIDVYKKSVPSVVNVSNMATRRDAFTMNMTEYPQGQGSGFIYNTEGTVVTNFHVISEAIDVKVTLDSGEEYQAKVVGVDQDKDIAVLQLDPRVLQDNKKGLKPLRLCDEPSTNLMIGQKVFAIGNPYGLQHTLTVGVVSGTGREIQSVSGRPIQDVIQTDAAINPGNSGGPLLDTSGCVIGINTAIYSPSGANTGVGFAIPAPVFKTSVDQIMAFGKVIRPALGISFAPDQSSEQLGVQGILVLNAREGGPAFKAGLMGTSRDEYGRLVLGDIITGINGKTIRNASDLYRILDHSKVGDTLDMEVLRAKSTEHIRITLEPNDA